MRRPVNPSAAKTHLATRVARTVAWLVTAALLNLALLPLHGATAASAAASYATICTDRGLQTVAIDLDGQPIAAHDAEQQAHGDAICPFCLSHWGGAPSIPPISWPSRPATRDLAAAPADRQDPTHRLWFLDGRSLRAPPHA